MNRAVHLSYMSDILPEYTPIKASITRADKDALTRILLNRRAFMSELVGAFVHNVREVGYAGDFLDHPIPIGPLDSTYLQDMRLIREERCTPDNVRVVRIRRLGILVVEQSVVAHDDDVHRNMPTIDITHLLNAMATW